MNLLMNKHFRSFVESKVARAWMIEAGLSEAAAGVKFKDTLYDDFNLMSYVLENVFPNTKSDGDNYLFVSDDCVHTDLKTKKRYNVGRVQIDVSKGEAYIKFPDYPGFIHGHIESSSGRIHCYGNYKRLYPNIIQIGFSSAILD